MNKHHAQHTHEHEGAHEHEHEHHPLSYKLLLGVLAVLLALTAATVGATRVSLAAFHIPNIAVSIFIASVKAVFVLWYFMHLKNEPVFLRWFFVIVIALLAIFIGFTIVDVAFR